MILKPSINPRRNAPCQKLRKNTFIPPLIARIPAERPPAIIEFQTSSLRRRAAKVQSQAEYKRPQIAKLPTSHQWSCSGTSKNRSSRFHSVHHSLNVGPFWRISPTSKGMPHCSTDSTYSITGKTERIPIIKAPPVSSINL